MKRVSFILIFILLLSVVYAKHSIASMSDYCSIPPFITASVKPNVVLVMDYSGSMQFPAYYSCADWGGYYDSQVAECAYGDYYDDPYAYQDYDSSKNYYGIFDPNRYYKYDSTNKYFVDNTNNCDYTDRIGSAPDCVSGNLLNFVTTTRIDAALKALIGGKASCDSNYCYVKAQGSRRKLRSSNIHCEFYVRPENYSYGDYASKDVLLDSYDYGGTCPVAGLESAHVVLREPKDKRTGVIQKNFDKVRFTFMVFGGDNREGVIGYGFNEDNLSTLLNKMQTEVPYAGTPTGEALWEVYDYLQQSNDHNYESNSNYIDKGSSRDPYYQLLNNGDVVPAWCRRSNVLLISDGEWNGNMDPVKPAYYLHHDDLRGDLRNKQTAKIFSLYAFSDTAEGANSLKTVSAFGSFKDINNCTQNWPYTFSGFPDDSQDVAWPRDNCNPSGNYKNCCKEWDEDQNGVPDTYYKASNGEQMEQALTKIFSDILKQSSSATSVSMLTQRTNKGSIALQAVFYPQKDFNGTKLDWVGYLYSWWLYNTRTAQNLREDTNGNKTLDILDDYILNWDFDNSTGAFTINAYNSTAAEQKGSKEATATYKSFDETHPIWEAGEKLADRSYNDRTIYTAVVNNNTDNKTDLIGFDTANETEFQAYLGNQASFPANMKVDDLINYIRGCDYNGARNRSYNNGAKTWKLGDIVYSTPNVVDYGNYSVAFVGANDGMLHAFRVGYVKSHLNNEHPISIQNSKFDNSTNKLGEELWAFIPKNALPYLRYLADPNYCHMYFVDLKPYVVGVDTNGNGIPNKKILIGGMRFGGAVGCKGTDCVNPPSDTCPDVSSNCTGLSSYFALDITKPLHPKFLWEFTNPDLGFTYSGPAFVTYKGTHYVVFASGPTDYEGDSDQPLRLFVLKLNPNFTIGKIYPIDNSTVSQFPNFKNAFGGRLFTNGIDYSDNGSTDYFFLGVSYNVGGKNKNNQKVNNWKGNVIAVHVDDFDPRQWGYTKILNNPAGPVVDSVKIARCFDRYFIYFGTGRWFYKTDDQGNTNGNDTERLYGIDITSCLDGTAPTCNVNAAHNTGICDELAGSSGSVAAWHIDLDPANGTYFKERDIADPTTTDQNIVFFTTIEPTSDICGFGGQSRIWGLNCATGGNFTSGCPGNPEGKKYTTSNPQGELLLQLSQGNIVEVKPSDFSGNGTSQWYQGIAPETPTPFVSPGGIKGELLLWLER